MKWLRYRATISWVTWKVICIPSSFNFAHGDRNEASLPSQVPSSPLATHHLQKSAQFWSYLFCGSTLLRQPLLMLLLLLLLIFKRSRGFRGQQWRKLCYIFDLRNIIWMKLLGVRHFRSYLTLPDHGKGCRLLYIKMHDYCKSILPLAHSTSTRVSWCSLAPWQSTL